VAADPPKSGRSGRGFVITGIVMMVIAVLGAGTATVLFGGSVNVDDITRDVVVTGAAHSEVPGRIGFRIIEDLSAEGDDSMTVGVATDTATGRLDCQILDVTGDEVDVRPGSVNDSFVSATIEVDWEPVVVAEGLPAGEYSAVCASLGEPSGSATKGGTPPTFGVSRVVTVDDMFDFVRPVFAIFAAIALGGVIGLIGLILLIVGLVIGNRSRRGPPGPPAPQYQQWGQNQWDQNQWGQGQSGQRPWPDR
jgi:hypothetical protein